MFVFDVSFSISFDVNFDVLMTKSLYCF